MALPAIIVEVANIILKELLKAMVRQVLSPVNKVINAYKMFQKSKDWWDFLKSAGKKQIWNKVQDELFKEVKQIKKAWDNKIEPLMNIIESKNREIGKSVRESLKNEANEFLSEKMGLDKMNEALTKEVQKLRDIVKAQERLRTAQNKLTKEQAEFIKAQQLIIDNQQQIIEQLIKKIENANKKFQDIFVPKKEEELKKTVEKIEKGKLNEIIDVVKGGGDKMDDNIGDFLPDDKNWKQNFYNDFAGEANSSFLNKILAEVERHIMYFDNLMKDEYTLLSSDADSVVDIKGFTDNDRKELFAKLFGLGADGSANRNERTGYKNSTPWTELKSDHYQNPDKSAKDLVNEHFLDIMRDYVETKRPDLEDELLEYFVEEATSKD